MEATTTDIEKKKKRQKMVIWSLVGVGTLAGGFCLWHFVIQPKLKGNSKKGAKDYNEPDDTPDYQLPAPPSASTFKPAVQSASESATATTTAKDDFPLKKGSKGPKVKSLQEGLNTRYSAGLKADGDFGGKTLTAVQKAMSDTTMTSVDETTYNVIVYGGGFDAADLATKLHTAAKNKNYADALKYLGQIKSTQDYSSVSDEIKSKENLTNFSNNSLVNTMLYCFTDETQKQNIRKAFTKMGLKYNGKSWSLSGLDGFTLITTSEAIVWKTPKEGCKVPSKMILGTEIEKRGEYTAFENNGQRFLVKTDCIKYL